ncbi:MAG: sigma-70 family RNA polymerase sigma factor [Pirellulales bacterium]|nr:sigma-70 family RNA polymerase sigma factor [Pirellulales bacterium]
MNAASVQFQARFSSVTAPQDRTEIFLNLLAEHERRLTYYALTLVPCQSTADDILQESKIVMWRNFDRFTIGTNFAAWARRIVLNQVLAFRKRKQREGLNFGEDYFHAVSEEIEQNLDAFEQRQTFLKGCIEKLPAEHRSMIQWRYLDEEAIEAIVQRTGRTLSATYRVLSRIRRKLFECVTQQLARAAEHQS